MDGTPAARAGIMSGDLITSIDGDAVQGLTLEQAVNKMKGPVHATTKLKIERKGSDKPIVVSLEREIIQERPVSFHTARGDIGYIRISSFNAPTQHGLTTPLAALSNQLPPD